MAASSLSAWFQANKLVSLVATVLILLLLIAVLSKPAQHGGSSTPSISTPERGVLTDDLKQSGQVVIQESSLSLVVSDVRKVADSITSYAKGLGGIFVSQSLTQPEEAPLAIVSVRVPTDKFDQSVEYFRNLSVKVSSENLVGTDVTRQSQDLDAQIKILEEGIRRLSEIRDRATTTADILAATREILSLQQQLDYLTSQKKALAEAVGMALITAHLSTDELSLPYQPTTGFRPEAIFKQAVRDLVASLYRAGEAAIWLGVYSVIWVPALLIIWALGKRFKIF